MNTQYTDTCIGYVLAIEEDSNKTKMLLIMIKVKMLLKMFRILITKL